MALSEAKKRANKKYDDKAYDQTTVRLPKGTKERIKATGSSTNEFIVKATLEKLDKNFPEKV